MHDGFRHLAAPLAFRYVRAQELLAAWFDVLTFSTNCEVSEEALTAPSVDALTISTNQVVVERALSMSLNLAVPSKESTCKLSLPPFGMWFLKYSMQLRL